MRGVFCESDPTIGADTVRQGYVLAAIRAKGLGSIAESDLEAPTAGELHSRVAQLRKR